MVYKRPYGAPHDPELLPYRYDGLKSEVIDRMRELRSGGMAVDKIAVALNAEGARPRAGQQWYATSVYRILRAAKAL
jgi:hypothetical protein